MDFEQEALENEEHRRNIANELEIYVRYLNDHLFFQKLIMEWKKQELINGNSNLSNFIVSELFEFKTQNFVCLGLEFCEGGELLS
jgi:hypothetical protein